MIRCRSAFLAVWLAAAVFQPQIIFAAPPDEGILTGPPTEERFPPLVLPWGYRATLFACDPLVEYPSVIALGPKPGTVFVAHDYTTGLGVQIVRRDEIRLLADTDGDGYADKSTVFAEGFNSIQGLAYCEGAVYAMHAPLLTVLHDVDGDGRAEQRRDLLDGLGLPPEENSSRLHCANGVTVGHDGWLYLALGDHGCDVQRLEGDRLAFRGGGILRCRADGGDLHVFAKGLRNIYDVALDDELNVFVRDNENDGGDYMIRVCHSFFGADHGYPYDYYERPQHALPPLLDLGRGSSAGVACYLDDRFGAELRGALFCCEWGRAVVSYGLRRAGSGFAAEAETDFAAAAPTDPYGLKPTDVIVDYDGSLLISDWGDGQRPQRGRGRIYRLQPHNAPQAARPPSPENGWLADLGSPSYAERVAAQRRIEASEVEELIEAVLSQKLPPLARMHGVWAIVRLLGGQAQQPLFQIAATDDDPRVQVQAIRALADLHDPVLVGDRLDARRGDASIAQRLATIGEQAEPSVLLEVVIALGRLQWQNAPQWLEKHLRHPDAPLAHAAMQTLRQADNWPAVLQLIDEPAAHPLQPIALRAVAVQFDLVAVDGLLERIERDQDPRRRGEYAALLARVHKRPGEWTYWGYRPPPRPANTELWERSEAIRNALNAVLIDEVAAVRAAALESMRRENVPVELAQLADWLRTERDFNRTRAMLEALADFEPREVRPLLRAVIENPACDVENRRAALVSFLGNLDAAQGAELLDIARSLEDGPVLADALAALGRRGALDSTPLLREKTRSREATIRASAIAALGELRSADAAPALNALLGDEDADVRRNAALAAGRIGASDKAGWLAELAFDPNDSVRVAALVALRELGAPNAVGAAVAALDRPACRVAALKYLAAFGDESQLESVRRIAVESRGSDVLAAMFEALAAWRSRTAGDPPARGELDRAIAEIQGDSGAIQVWRLAASPADANAHMLAAISDGQSELVDIDFPIVLAADAEGVIESEPADGAQEETTIAAVAEFEAPAASPAQFFASGSGGLRVWLNGKAVYERAQAAAFAPDSDRFEAELVAGLNRLAVWASSPAGGGRLQVRFRPQSASADRERLARLALAGRGNADRGREVFYQAEKSLCAKCHRIGREGGEIGPDLTGIGDRFSRIHLVESILEPSRTIAPSYDTIAVVLADGRILSGVKVSTDKGVLVLGTSDGSRVEIQQTDIEQQLSLPTSTMPDGIEKRLSDQEFVDLVAFLAAQQRPAPGK